MAEPETIRFSGKVLAVKARIRLIRSFDQVSHHYQGYTLVLRDDEAPDTVRRIAIGPGAHAKHQFRIGNRVSGNPHVGAHIASSQHPVVEEQSPAPQHRQGFGPPGGSQHDCVQTPRSVPSHCSPHWGS